LAFALSGKEPQLLKSAIMVTGPTRFTYYKCDGFEVWGKEYQGPGETATWRLRVFAEQDRRIETYEDVRGEPPGGTRTGESKAMRDAIASWLAPAKDQQDHTLDQPSFVAPKILKTMTVQEAAAAWNDPRSAQLAKWIAEFNMPLEDFRSGHIVSYEKKRLGEVNYAVMWTEILALRALLKAAGVGEEIESLYTGALDKVKLTAEERKGLSPRVRAYVEYLEQEVSSVRASADRLKGTLRKINRDHKR
jgi:hypothetical protein